MKIVRPVHGFSGRGWTAVDCQDPNMSSLADSRLELCSGWDYGTYPAHTDKENPSAEATIKSLLRLPYRKFPELEIKICCLISEYPAKVLFGDSGCPIGKVTL